MSVKKMRISQFFCDAVITLTPLVRRASFYKFHLVSVKTLFRTSQSVCQNLLLPLLQFTVDFQPKKVKSVNIQYLFSDFSV